MQPEEKSLYLKPEKSLNAKLAQYRACSFGCTGTGFIALGTYNQTLIYGRSERGFKVLSLTDIATLVDVSHDATKIGFSFQTGQVCLLTLGQKKTLAVEGEKYRIFDVIGSSEKITALKFHSKGDQLLVGTNSGLVFLFQVCVDGNVSVSRILELESPIVQISTQESILAISSEHKTVICDTGHKTFCEVGTKPRQGRYGADLLGDQLFCARPGARIWRASLKGQVKSTLHLKAGLQAKEPIGHLESTSVVHVSKQVVHSFSRVLCTKFGLVTHNASVIYFIHPDSLEDVEFVRHDGKIADLGVEDDMLWVMSNDVVQCYRVLTSSYVRTHSRLNDVDEEASQNEKKTTNERNSEIKPTALGDSRVDSELERRLQQHGEEDPANSVSNKQRDDSSETVNQPLATQHSSDESEENQNTTSCDDNYYSADDMLEDVYYSADNLDKIGGPDGSDKKNKNASNLTLDDIPDAPLDAPVARSLSKSVENLSQCCEEESESQLQVPGVLKSLIVRPMPGLLNERLKASISAFDLSKTSEDNAEDDLERELKELSETAKLWKTKIKSKTKSLLQKTGDKIKQQLPVAGTEIIAELSRKSNVEEISALRCTLVEQCEFILSFDDLNTVDEVLGRTIKKFKHDYKKLKNLTGNQALFDRESDANTFHETLSFFMQNPVQKCLRKGSKKQEHPACSYFDTSITSRDSHVRRMLEVFKYSLKPALIIDALPGTHFSSWEFLISLEDEAVRQKFSHLTLKSKKGEFQEIIQDSLSPEEKSTVNRLRILSFCFFTMKNSTDTVRKMMLQFRECLTYMDLFFLHLKVCKEDQNDYEFLGFLGDDDDEVEWQNRFTFCVIYGKLAEKNQDLAPWLSKNVPIFDYLKRTFTLVSSSLEEREDPVGLSSLNALGFLILDVLDFGPGAVHFCKQAKFWPGYVRSLKALSTEDQNHLVWEELSLVLELGDAKLLSFLQFLDSAEHCGRVLAERSRILKQGGVSWDDLGLEILKNLGPEEGRAVLIHNSHLMPKRSFSAGFYKEVIRRSIFDMDVLAR